MSGRGDFSLILPLLQKLSPVLHEYDDVYTVNRKYDAIYRGILNFINYAGSGLLNFENGNPVASSSILEDHHIFPKDYLRKNPAFIEYSLDGQVLIDCVANRTLIPKLTNIRVSNKAPSAYLGLLLTKNPDISLALESHLIPADLVTGAYDDLYIMFLEDRARLIIERLNSLVMQERDILTSNLGDSPAALVAEFANDLKETAFGRSDPGTGEVAVERDWSAWDESTIPASNAGIINLKHRIDDMVRQQDLAGLQGLRFKGAREDDSASTYYRRAGQYLRAWIARVRVQIASVSEDCG